MEHPATGFYRTRLPYRLNPISTLALECLAATNTDSLILPSLHSPQRNHVPSTSSQQSLTGRLRNWRHRLSLSRQVSHHGFYRCRTSSPGDQPLTYCGRHLRSLTAWNILQPRVSAHSSRFLPATLLTLWRQFVWPCPPPDLSVHPATSSRLPVHPGAGEQYSPPPPTGLPDG